MKCTNEMHNHNSPFIGPSGLPTVCAIKYKVLSLVHQPLHNQLPHLSKYYQAFLYVSHPKPPSLLSSLLSVSNSYLRAFAHTA